MRVYQKGQLVLDEKVQDQISINTDARETIRDLFPKIPDNDLFQIIKTAFQLGDGKVGTADEIPLVRRAQLSVVAHIRHTYTSYDKLLRRLPYNQARHEVEEETLKKLVEWRGDDDAKDDGARQRAVDELVREVIVVSDEEDSDSEVEGAEQIRQDELRVEELPSDSYGPPPHRPFSPSRDLVYEDAPSGYRFVPQIARRERLAAAQIEAQDRNRRAIWENARQAYRTRVLEPEPQYERIYSGRTSPVRTLIPLAPPSGTVVRREYLGPAPSQRPIDYEVGNSLKNFHCNCRSTSRLLDMNRTNSIQVLPPSRPVSPRHSGFTADGRRFERIPLEPEPAVYRRRTPPVDVSYSASRARPRTPPHTNQRRRSASPDVGHDSVVHSIEDPNSPFSPTQVRQPASGQTRTWPTPPSNFAARRDPHLHQPGLIDLSSSQDLASRRSRVDGNTGNPFQPSGNRYPFSENSRPAYATQPGQSQIDRRVFDFDHCESTTGEVVQAMQPSAGRRVLDFDGLGAATSNSAFLEPLYQHNGQYRQIHEVDSSEVRRVMVPEGSTGVQYTPNDLDRRLNPFGARPPASQFRVLEPLPPAAGNLPRGEPRRILEPLPAERYPIQQYSQNTYMPVTERRVIYPAPPPNHAPDRR